MKRLYPSNSQFPHFVPVLGSLVLIICDKSLNPLLIVSCVFVDVKFMHKKESQSPPVRTHAFLVRALRFFHSLAVLFLIFFLFFFKWSSCKEKENLSETISSTPQIFFFPLGLESFGVLVSLRRESFLSWSASVYQKHKFSSCIELEGPSL